MKKNETINVSGVEIRVTKFNDEDYICLTDMLKAKDGEFFITDWLHNRNTLEYIGIWEKVYNPDFNYGEFATIRNQAGLNSFKIGVQEFAERTNSIRIKAKAGRCISNMENINAVMINDGVSQPQRLKRLNEIAIHQMRILSQVDNRNLLK